MRLDAPPDWLIEVSLARSEADALSSLGLAKGRYDRVEVLAALMASWRDLLDQDSGAASAIARALYYMALYENEAPSAEAAGEMASYWDAIDLARQGVYGDLDALLADLRGFLGRWACPGSWDRNGSN